MPTSAHRQTEQIGSLTDPFARTSLLVAYHVRRYALLYVSGLIGAVALGVLPAVNGSGPSSRTASSSLSAGGGSTSAGGSGQSASATQSSGSAASSGGAGTGAGAGAGGAGGAGGSSGSGGSSGQTGAGGAVVSSGGSSASGPIGTVTVGTGITRGGTACGPGVRQIPYSAYADYCVAKFAGNNGGATANGVTATAINIAVRKDSDASGANALAGQAEGEAAGGVSNDANWGYIQQIVKYLNTQFELYGRQVKLDLFNGQGNGTNESLGQGQAAACADADTAANSLHAFGDFNWGGIFESQPFSDCAPRYHLYIPEGAAYYPEYMYKSWNPYVWGITMNCTLIANEVGEWAGKQLAQYPTKWAGSDGVVPLNGKQRKFGTYVPNNAGYESCANQIAQVEESQYHVAKSREDQYDYALDVSTFPQDAQKAIIQFAANDDTTVVLACDPISPIFLTQDAVQQNYYPEWALIGVALTDTDNWAQLWDQKAITNHLFGLSQAASTASILDPHGEAGRVLTASGVPLNPSTAVDYFELVSMFNQLQIAGPDLTAAAIGANTAKIPPGTGQAGTWNFNQGFHTAIDDSRQIYWDASGTSSANGKTGTYLEIYAGKRFGLGQFPTGEPPYYP
ncbi:MAG TPA: hypothetical protein VNF50_10490 [Acidimicrobiales bacterium]|nr:hypothetical protein [Acidimicrobiales bacterium]